MKKQQADRGRDIGYWEEHVRGLSEHRGSLASYCREHGVKDWNLKYWRRRLDVTSKSGVSKSKRAAFVAVKVLPTLSGVGQTQQSQCPDARWVAELIVHLWSGSGVRAGRIQ